jgi:hypothetical protein
VVRRVTYHNRRVSGVIRHSRAFKLNLWLCRFKLLWLRDQKTKLNPLSSFFFCLSSLFLALLRLASFSLCVHEMRGAHLLVLFAATAVMAQGGALFGEFEGRQNYPGATQLNQMNAWFVAASLPSFGSEC